MLNAVDLEEYEYISPLDAGDPKTVFVLRPLLQFEFMKYAGIYSAIFDDITVTEDETGFTKISRFFATEAGEKLVKVIMEFVDKKLVEIRNICVKGKATTLKGNEIDRNLIDAMTAFELMSDAINRVTPSKEEEKNSV